MIPVTTRRKRYWVVVALAIIAITVLINYHWSQIGVGSDWRVVVNATAFVSLVSQLVLAHANREFETTEVMHRHVCVVVPVYNEDPAVFRNIRYLSLKRSDVGVFRQIGVWLMSPLAVLLNVYLCTFLQYFGLFTVRAVGWSTRTKVEVRLEES